jgi:hypothetical protein
MTGSASAVDNASSLPAFFNVHIVPPMEPIIQMAMRMLPGEQQALSSNNPMPRSSTRVLAALLSARLCQNVGRATPLTGLPLNQPG